MIDHAWLPTLRTLSLPGERLVPENFQRLVRVGANDDDDEEDGHVSLRRTNTPEEAEVARVPLYVANPRTSLGVLIRVTTLQITNIDVYVSVLPRFEGVRRLVFDGNACVDLGELAQRFPVLRDLVVDGIVLVRDGGPRIQGSVSLTPMVGDTPRWVTALGALAALRTLEIRESASPRFAPKLGNCRVMRHTSADHRHLWRPWLDAVTAALPHPVEWRWHASVLASTEAPSGDATCRHKEGSESGGDKRGGDKGGDQPLVATASSPCVHAADCILPWYRKHRSAAIKKFFVTIFAHVVRRLSVFYAAHSDRPRGSREFFGARRRRSSVLAAAAFHKNFFRSRPRERDAGAGSSFGVT